MSRLVYFNGKFVPEKDAKISIFDSALMFGDMVFEMTRSFNKKQFKLREHLERLYVGIRILRIPLNMTIDELEHACLETIAMNEPSFGPHDEHRLMIHGLCDNPLVFDMDDLARFPSVTEIRFIECPANGGMEWRGPQMEALQFTHGMLSCSEWTGVRLSTLLAEVGVKKAAKWILAEGADGAAMGRSIPIEKALDDVIVAYAQNGEMIRPEQGYPIRLVNPGWEGNTSVKWLRRIELGDKPWHLREETSKYTDVMPDGSARQFTWVQEANSVITSICPENPLKNRGFHEVEGVAWSGRGKIKHVDVSFDGGISWQRASLKGLILDKALTRFSFNWNWDGSPKLMQSRAIDETGYVQPTLEQLRAVRGLNSIYHKNSIQTWQLSHTGEVKNAQRS